MDAVMGDVDVPIIPPSTLSKKEAERRVSLFRTLCRTTRKVLGAHFLMTNRVP